MLGKSKLNDSKKLIGVNQCIYCGRKGVTLSDEHIISVAIGGKWILPKSSCKRCSKITGKLEGHCFRGTLIGFRAIHNITGRRPKEMPKELPLVIVKRDGRVEIDNLPITKYPAFLLLPQLNETPTILTNKTPDADKKIDVWGTVFNSDTLDNYRNSQAGFVPINLGKWLRMLAKIAHSYAIAQLGVNGFKPLLTKLIRGHDNFPTHYIGCLGEAITAKEDFLHRLDLITLNDDKNAIKFIVVNLRLFANFGSPQYHIVVGTV